MEALFNFIFAFYIIYTICILAWALASWLPMVSPALAYNSTIVGIRRFLDSVVLPYVRLFRFVPPVRMGGAMVDLSALVAILALQIVGGKILLPLLHNALVA
ncbi:MAG: hypothetical protein JWM98_1232 [Thermoleophilia bacterium]|nr:hypothetical protein [Thermoleophilia bacterium]